MPSLLEAAALTLLAATTALPAAAQDRSRDDQYRAVGTEPFWSVTIDRGTMRFEAPGQRAVSVGKPRPIIGFNGERYETRRMTVDITHVPCSDGMSDRRYPDTVVVTFNRRTWRGCGGAPAAQQDDTSIIDGTWRVEMIDGRRLRGNAEARLRFDRGRLSGTGGCNELTGAAKVERGFLTTGPIAQTRRACPGDAIRQEARIVETLGKRLSVTSNPAGKLVLTARDGSGLTLAPIAPAGRPRR